MEDRLFKLILKCCKNYNKSDAHTFNIQILGDSIMDKSEEQDVALTSIIKQICNYAIANNMKPNETLKDVFESILALLEISSFDGWVGDDMNDDLISRQKILDELDRVISIGVKGKDGRTPISAEIFRYFVEAQPSDQPKAVAVKFFDNPYTGKQFTTCSRCDGKISPKDKWCKHCGAKIIKSEV